MSCNELHIYGLRVLSHCGSWAYGDVYYCEDASGKHVALKVISKCKIGSGWERELKGITNYRRLTEDSPFLLKIPFKNPPTGAGLQVPINQGGFSLFYSSQSVTGIQPPTSEQNHPASIKR